MATTTRQAILTAVKDKSCWTAQTLEMDKSWVLRLSDQDRRALRDALEYFQLVTDRSHLNAQWLHGHMVPDKHNFPLGDLERKLEKIQDELENGFGIILIRGFPLEGFTEKELQLMYTGLCSHVGTVRPQTMFGEMVQEIKDAGQASTINRRGSKHNLGLGFHNDPADIVGFLCIRPAASGGMGRFVSAMTIHDALLEKSPDCLQTLFQDYSHTHQEYLFVKTGYNSELIPDCDYYSMPIFHRAENKVAVKYSRFYIDQSQEIPQVERYSEAQIIALEELENEISRPEHQFAYAYQPGDVVFCNNMTCLHGRDGFSDDPQSRGGRLLYRVWLSSPVSRALPESYRHYFFRNLEAGGVRGGIPLDNIDYAD